MLHTGSLRTAGSQGVGGTRQMLSFLYPRFPERHSGEPRAGPGATILSFSTVFNSRNHYNHPVRKAIRTGASKLPFLNCLYQKLNSIKLHNCDNEQYSSLTVVLLKAASSGCSEGKSTEAEGRPGLQSAPQWAVQRGGPTRGPHLLAPGRPAMANPKGCKPPWTDTGKQMLLVCLLACVS